MKTYTTTITSANILEVEAGTTGPCGGDSGHGGRTMLRIADAAGTDIEVEWNPEKKEVTILLGGDAEMGTFVAALRYALDVYDTQIRIKEMEDRLSRLGVDDDPFGGF